MNIETVYSIVSRVCFFGGFLFLVLMIVEGVAAWSGASIFGGIYNPKSFLEVAAVLFLVVITLLLRQVRDELKGKS